jgi:hypothetical protein
MDRINTAQLFHNRSQNAKAFGFAQFSSCETANDGRGLIMYIASSVKFVTLQDANARADASRSGQIGPSLYHGCGVTLTSNCSSRFRASRNRSIASSTSRIAARSASGVMSFSHVGHLPTRLTSAVSPHSGQFSTLHSGVNR